MNKSSLTTTALASLTEKHGPRMSALYFANLVEMLLHRQWDKCKRARGRSKRPCLTCERLQFTHYSLTGLTSLARTIDDVLKEDAIDKEEDLLVLDETEITA